MSVGVSSNIALSLLVHNLQWLLFRSNGSLNYLHYPQWSDMVACTLLTIFPVEVVTRVNVSPHYCSNLILLSYMNDAFWLCSSQRPNTYIPVTWESCNIIKIISWAQYTAWALLPFKNCTSDHEGKVNKHNYLHQGLYVFAAVTHVWQQLCTKFYVQALMLVTYLCPYFLPYSFKYSTFPL